VVFPWVPATASTQRSCSTARDSHSLEQLFDDRLPAGHDIAHDDNVGRGFELRGIEALDHLDAQCRELRAHGRIDVAIGAGDAMTGRARDGGDAAHERAADA